MKSRSRTSTRFVFSWLPNAMASSCSTVRRSFANGSRESPELSARTTRERSIYADQTEYRLLPRDLGRWLMLQQVIPPLQAEGYEVMAAQYSLDTLEGDVATVNATLGRVSSPAILVGHSYGGTVITAAGTDDRVAGLVYIAALAPDAERDIAEPAGEVSRSPTSSRTSRSRTGASGCGRTARRASRAICPTQEQKVVWATHYAPAADLFEPECRRHRLEVEAELVHRGQQRPHSSSRPGALPARSGWAPPLRAATAATSRCSRNPTSCST